MPSPIWISTTMAQRHSMSLSSCHPLLQAGYLYLASYAPKDAFLYVTTGYRGESAQNAAQATKASRARFGQSWHNVTPALAFDVVPVWQDTPQQIEWSSKRTVDLLTSLATSVKGVLGWGGVWHQPAGDIYHFQLPPIELSPGDYGNVLTSYTLMVTPKENTEWIPQSDTRPVSST